MAGVFKIKKANTFKKGVEVFCGDESLGTLQVEFLVLGQAELTQMLEECSDHEFCERIVAGVGDIPVEGSEEVLKGDDAKHAALEDARAVAAITASYLEAMKGRNFRDRGPRKRR